MKSKQWWVAIRQLLGQVDAVHIRCPNNISILGLLALRRSKCFRQAVYTGNWNGYPGEPFTYRWQRSFLKRHFEGPVAVYGNWPEQPAHIVPSYSPSCSIETWHEESLAVSRKIENLRKTARLYEPLRLLSVGALNLNKNQQLVIHAVKILNERNIKTELYLLGDGERHGFLVKLAGSLGLDQQVHFNGSTAKGDVRKFYRATDFVVQPSFTEGFSKVSAEAFTHGAIPLLSDVSRNAEVIGGGDRGRCFPTDDANEIVRQIVELVSDTTEMIRLIQNGREYARSITLESWRIHIKQMLEQHWLIKLKG